MPMEFVDISEDMLEKKLAYMRANSVKVKSGRRSRSNHTRPKNISVNVRKESTEGDDYPDPETVYLRETENLRQKSMYMLSIGVQCDLKLAHPHFRAIQSQVNKLKVELEKKNKIINRLTVDSTSQVDDLRAQLQKLTEEKLLI